MREGAAVPLFCFSQRLGGSAGEFGDDVSGDAKAL